MHKDSGKDIPTSQHNYAVVLQQAIQHIPNQYYEYLIRTIAMKLGQSLAQRATGHMPDINVVRVIQRICWASAAGEISLLQGQCQDIHNVFEKVGAMSYGNDTVRVRYS